jgi:hypothetical protein
VRPFGDVPLRVEDGEPAHVFHSSAPLRHT